MVERMLPFLRRLIGENISLVWTPECHRTLIKIDPSQIDLILGNLCVNSRDAISGIGKIIIKTEVIHVDKADCIAGHPCKKPGSYVTLVVTDNGSGIEKNDLPHIFEPFFTTKGVGRGTGMGLSTVYGIVKQNNSFIDCRSERGRGSSFIIYIPLHSGYEGTEERELSSPITHRKETILLVEDEPDILNICKFTLENNGYKVLNAATPGEAISIANKHKGHIHVLLTDVVLPEMNGCDLSKKLLSLYPDLRTLFMSGYTTDIITGHGLLDPGVNFIQKPFSINTLLLSLQNIFETR
jgi:CheY-like chemotaxis protein